MKSYNNILHQLIANLEWQINMGAEAMVVDKNNNYLANWVVMRNENDETIDYVKQGLYRVLGLLHGKI